MATATSPNSSGSGASGTGAIVNYFKPPVPAPAAPLPMTPIPPKPLNPFFSGGAPILIDALPVAAPTGCSGGNCPMAAPPPGGSVTVTRVDGGATPVLRAAADGGSGLPPWLTAVYAGLPLWVWLLVAVLAIVLVKR